MLQILKNHNQLLKLPLHRNQLSPSTSRLQKTRQWTRKHRKRKKPLKQTTRKRSLQTRPDQKICPPKSR
jgi:hypothetical protein